MKPESANQSGWKEKFRDVVKGIGIILGPSILMAGMVLGGLALDRRHLNALIEACRMAPTTVGKRQIDHYGGTVVAKPSDAGYFGDNDGPNRIRGKVIFVQTEGREQPLAIRRHRGDSPRVGEQLQFCAASAEAGFWWPLVGYEAGLFGGRLYGSPNGPFEAVRWIDHTNRGS